MSGDPLRDAERYDERSAERLKRLPMCDDCGEAIQTDEYYMIADRRVCPLCLTAYYRRWTEDAM